MIKTGLLFCHVTSVCINSFNLNFTTDQAEGEGKLVSEFKDNYGWQQIVTSCFNQHSKCSNFVSTHLYKSSSHWSINLHCSYFPTHDHRQMPCLLLSAWRSLFLSYRFTQHSWCKSHKSNRHLCSIWNYFCSFLYSLSLPESPLFILRLSVFLLSYCTFIWSVITASMHLSISHEYRSDKPLLILPAGTTSLFYLLHQLNWG